MNNPESEFILHSFEKNFSRYRNEPIVIYGIGLNTKLILEHVQGFNIVGLMDAERIGDTVMGLPVLSPAEAAEKTGIIVIVARLNVVNIIYKRIEFLERERGIAIYDLYGGRPGQAAARADALDIDYWGTTEEQLKAAIDSHDVILFDIFDTLITRKVLRPQHIFDIMAEELNGCPDFKARRLEAEQELFDAGIVPGLEQIYDLFQKKTGIDASMRQKIYDLELTTEKRFIVPRRKMVELFQYALARDKKVYLLSDMYLHKPLMENLLHECGIKGYTDVLVSCDHNCHKEDGALFEFFRNRAKGNSVLHIGDNPVADIEMAKRSGFDTFRVYSGYEMLLHSSYRDLLVEVNSTDQYRMLGQWVAHAFNDPFALNPSRGKPVVNDFFELGYLYIGPVMLCFMNWLVTALKDKGYDKILFFSRDGFLVEQLYRQVAVAGMPEGIYFKTSRRAASVAAIYDADDIAVILKKAFACRLEDLLYQRFGVRPDPEDVRNRVTVVSADNMETALDYVMSYRERIIANAAAERACYLEYIESLGIKPEDRLAVFDLVSSGTTQYFMERLMNRKLDGYYFGTANLPNDFYRENEIVSFLGNSLTYYAPVYQSSKYYLLLESIMTSPEAPLICCGGKGKFLYYEELEPTRNWNALKRCHEGIGNFLSEWFSTAPRLQIMDFLQADQIYGILMQKQTIVDDSLKKAFIMESNYDFTKEYKVWDCLV